MFGGLSCDNHDRDRTSAAPDVLEKTEPGHFRQLDVGDNTHAPREVARLQKLLRREVALCLVPT